MMFEVPAEREKQVLDDLFEELLTRCDDAGYTTAHDLDLDRCATSLGIDWLNALDLIAAELARRYNRGTASYQFGDSLANDLHSIMIFRIMDLPDDAWPKLFSDVYEAFDSGEWPPKSEEIDPVAMYTNPAIAEIVANLR